MFIILFNTKEVGLKANSLKSEFYPWDYEFKKNVSMTEKKASNKLQTPIITSTPQWVLVKSIRFFQVVISPQDGPNCRYVPTCSQYGLLCIKNYGVLKGLIMTADRYMRCNPLGLWGRDLPEENYFWDKIFNKKK